VNRDAGHDARAAAAMEVVASARGRGHNDFKIPLLRRTIEATLAQAATSS
jgi:xanthine dehydrogenase YagS FAD-binding subunit